MVMKKSANVNIVRRRNKNGYLLGVSLMFLFSCFFIACTKKTNSVVLRNQPQPTSVLSVTASPQSKIHEQVSLSVGKILDNLISDVNSTNVRIDKAKYNALYKQLGDGLRKEGIAFEDVVLPTSKGLVRDLASGVLKLNEYSEDEMDFHFVDDVLKRHLKSVSASAKARENMYYLAALFKSVGVYVSQHAKQMELLMDRVDFLKSKGEFHIFSTAGGVGWRRFKCRMGHAFGKGANSRHAFYGFMSGLFDNHDCSKDAVTLQVRPEREEVQEEVQELAL